MSHLNTQAHLPTAEESEAMTKAIEARNLRRHLDASDPFSKAVIWLFLPGFLSRSWALLHGKVVWLI